MKDRHLIILALVLGVIAVVLVNRRIGELEAASEVPTVIFYRAVGDIPPGEFTVGDARLEGRLEQVMGIPAAFADSYPTALRGPSLADYADRKIEHPLPSGHFLESRHLVPVDMSLEMRRQIPAGHQLIALPASSLTTAGFLIRPGDRIDVYQHRAAKTRGGDPTVEEEVVCLAQNVEVFSVDSTVKGSDGASSESRGRSYSVITIPVPAERVTEFLLAREHGPMTFSLRSDAEE